MALRKVNGKICCADCDCYFDQDLQLIEGARCPNGTCLSNRDTAIGGILLEIAAIDSKPVSKLLVAQALQSLIPVRADSESAGDIAVLKNLQVLLRSTQELITKVEARCRTKSEDGSSV